MAAMPDQSQKTPPVVPSAAKVAIEAQGASGGGDEAQAAAAAAAAVVVQKVYRSYRARRHLADCAVMNKSDDPWWNVLDGALLRQRSEVFYAYKSEENVGSRWTRVRKKAAKVGKGLSQDEKARKLHFKHWLEAVDPRHRYGLNLYAYYTDWEKTSTKEPFFYWLDVGEGKSVDLPECPRSKLQKHQIKYLGPEQRKQYEAVVVNGKVCYKESQELVHTPQDEKWIFVMSTAGKLYVGKKEKGTFQHSTFLAGAAAKAAGYLVVNNGTLEYMEALSGHYRPSEEDFSGVMKILEELGTDLSTTKVCSVSEAMGRLESGIKDFVIEAPAKVEPSTLVNVAVPMSEMRTLKI